MNWKTLSSEKTEHGFRELQVASLPTGVLVSLSEYHFDTLVRNMQFVPMSPQDKQFLLGDSEELWDVPHTTGEPVIPLDASTAAEWPRVRDLPEAEREPFENWVRLRCRPLLTGVSDEDQDAYYAYDYKAWKTRRSGLA